MAGVPYNYNPLAARLFPQERTFWDKLADYGKGKAQSAFETLWGAATLPGDVYAGKVDQYAFNPQTGEVGPSPELMRRSADLAGSITLGAGAVPAVGTELGMGIRAYHGSPHDFDRFSLDKIGTGEGAQAYGHGLYFAENEGVAKSYRDALTYRDSINESMDPRKVGEAVYDIAAENGIVVDDKIPWGPTRGLASKEDIVQSFVDGRASPFDLSPAYQRQIVERLKPPGRMYEVEIDAATDDFLDWDKPLSEQPPKVKKALEKLGLEADDASGQWLVNAFDSPQAASSTLKAAGIKGIKYLDAGSRRMKGELTNNYVAFDDEMVKILRKYGIAAPVIGGAAAVGAQGEPQKPRA